jgi:hypothetical protein
MFLNYSECFILVRCLVFAPIIIRKVIQRLKLPIVRITGLESVFLHISSHAAPHVTNCIVVYVECSLCRLIRCPEYLIGRHCGISRQTEDHSSGDHLLSVSQCYSIECDRGFYCALFCVFMPRVSQCPISLRSKHMDVMYILRRLGICTTPDLYLGGTRFGVQAIVKFVMLSHSLFRQFRHNTLIRPRPIPFQVLPIHYLTITLLLDAMQSEIQRAT